MGAGGAALRFGGLFLRLLQFGCAAVALGIFSYFLAALADHNLPIADRWRAVEGISGSAVLYTIFGVVLTLCLGGVAFFGFLAVILDICFIGAFIYVAWTTRHGANSCTGNVRTPLGNGNANNNIAGYNEQKWVPNLHTACQLNTAVFAVAIISCFLFALSAIWQVMMVKHHKKEKKYGPSPANDYTSGTAKRPFWKRNKKVYNKDAEAAGAFGGRASGETGTTVGQNNAFVPEPKYGEPGYVAPGNTYHDRTTRF